jgi:arginase
MKLGVIGIPSSAGGRSIGQEKAPRALREAGLIKRLAATGHEVVDYGDIPSFRFAPDAQHPRAQNGPTVLKVCKLVANKVAKVLLDGFWPVVLGGDCTIAIGSLAGMIDLFPNVGLAYLDADADLNTPETTPSGIFDGMVVAHIIGRGDKDLSHIAKRYPLLREEEILLFGLNPTSGYVDPPEIKFLETSPILRFPIDVIHRQGVESAAREALKGLETRVQKVFVHLDVDFIGGLDMPAADIPHKSGLSLDDATTALKTFLGSEGFAGMEITEFNAEKDKQGRFAKTLVELVASALLG